MVIIDYDGRTTRWRIVKDLNVLIAQSPVAYVLEDYINFVHTASLRDTRVTIDIVELNHYAC